MENIIRNNVVASGGKQNNSILDICLKKDVHLTFLSRPTHIATAQDFGSPLATKYSYGPLNELITSFGSGDIEAKRFHGQNIYENRTGKLMNMFGDVQDISMDDMTKVDGEGSTILGSIIACLSIPMTKTALSPLVASAFVLYMHGSIDASMEGIVQMIQAKVAKYAGAIISRDIMCNKLENTKQDVLRLVKARAPHIRYEKLFLPPFTPFEEQDFVAFIVQLWTSKAEGQKIYIRSVKLLALSLLLSDYGWYIDVFVEKEDPSSPNSPIIIPIKQDTGAFSVIYSSTSAPGSDRTYVENHERFYLRTPEQYATSICKTQHMGETSGLSLSETNQDQEAFMRGYNAMTKFCEDRLNFKLTISTEGRIKLDINGLHPRHPEGYRAFLKARVFLIDATHGLILDLIASVLSDLFPDFDWILLDEDINQWDNPKAPCTTLLKDSPNNCPQLWASTGAALAMLDRIVISIVNIPETSLVRTLAGQSISMFFQRSTGYVTSLLNGDLEPSSAVKFCAARLAGVNPTFADDHESGPNTEDLRIIGYWNGQQGLLLSPVFERSLYCDLPYNKTLPLTFHNIPMIGMVTDEGGWIRSGKLQTTFNRSRRFPSSTQRSCDVVMEYRPHFERDSRSVIAVVYLDGVYHNVYALSGLLSSTRLHFSHCSHSIDTLPQRPPPRAIPLGSLEPGVTTVPKDDEPHMITPQGNAVSRLFCTMAYGKFFPVIQNGCLDCAIGTAESKKAIIIIPRV